MISVYSRTEIIVASAKSARGIDVVLRQDRNVSTERQHYIWAEEPVSRRCGIATNSFTTPASKGALVVVSWHRLRNLAEIGGAL